MAYHAVANDDDTLLLLGIAVDAVAVDGTVTVDGMKLVDDVIMTTMAGIY